MAVGKGELQKIKEAGRDARTRARTGKTPGAGLLQPFRGTVAALPGSVALEIARGDRPVLADVSEAETPKASPPHSPYFCQSSLDHLLPGAGDIGRVPVLAQRDPPTGPPMLGQTGCRGTNAATGEECDSPRGYYVGIESRASSLPAPPARTCGCREKGKKRGESGSATGIRSPSGVNASAEAIDFTRLMKHSISTMTALTRMTGTL